MRNRGFTLVELALVLVVVAALIAVSLFFVQGRRATFASQQIHEAIAERDLESVERLLSMGADVEALDAGGFTPLHAAVMSGSIEIAGLLLERGADLQVPMGEVGLSCLHWAIQNGSTGMTRFLLDSGADVDAYNAVYGTPLFLALRGGSKLRLLLDYGADLDAKNSAGLTALHIVAEENRDEVLQLLIEHGADSSVRDDRLQETPLDRVMRLGFAGRVRTAYLLFLDRDGEM